MTSKVRRWVGAGGVALLLVFSVPVVHRLMPGAQAQTTQYVTATVGKGTVDESIAASGTLQPETSLSVTFNAPGEVASVAVGVGSQVKQGQVLAALADTQGLASSVAQAQASYQQAETQLQDLEQPSAQSVAQAQATLASAEAQLQKLEDPSLTVDPATVQADQVKLKNAQLAVQQAQGTLKQDQAALATAQQAETLTAPVAGTVGSVPASVGQSLSGGQTVLTILPPGAAAQIDVQVPQQSNVAVQVGDAASADIPALNQVLAGTVTAVGTGTAGSGTASTSSSTASRGSTATTTTVNDGTLDVTVALSNPPATLTDGMTALVNIFGGVSAVVSANVQATGSVQYADEWDVTAAQGGTLAQLLVQPGSVVTAGEALATLTGTSLDTAVQSAQQTVAQAQVGVAQAQANVQAAQVQLQSDQNPQPPTAGDLAAQQAQVAADQAALTALQQPTASAVASAQAAVAAAQASLQDKQTELGQLTLTAPSSGTVVSDSILPAELVADGTAAFQIETVSQLQLVIPVDEVDIAKVKVGQQAAITLQALPGQSFQGKVVQVAPAANTSSASSAGTGVSTFDVTVSVPANAALKPGMSATATIQVASHTNVIRVPAEAVQGSGSKGVVRVLQSGAVQAQPVGLGLTSNAWTEITSGLTVGQTIVVASAASTTSTAAQGHPGGPGGPGGLGALGGGGHSGGGGRAGG